MPQQGLQVEGHELEHGKAFSMVSRVAADNPDISFSTSSRGDCVEVKMVMPTPNGNARYMVILTDGELDGMLRWEVSYLRGWVTDNGGSNG